MSQRRTSQSPPVGPNSSVATNIKGIIAFLLPETGVVDNYLQGFSVVNVFVQTCQVSSVRVTTEKPWADASQTLSR